MHNVAFQVRSQHTVPPLRRGRQGPRVTMRFRCPSGALGVMRCSQWQSLQPLQPALAIACVQNNRPGAAALLHRAETSAFWKVKMTTKEYKSEVEAEIFCLEPDCRLFFEIEDVTRA